MDERNKCESAEEQDKIDVKHGIVIAIFAIIGGLIAVGSFWLFFRMRNTVSSFAVFSVRSPSASMLSSMRRQENKWKRPNGVR